MPSIYNNVANINVQNNKKLSSKLTFEVGETFRGKIVSNGEGKDVVIKLPDGWQFSAEIEGEFDPNQGGLVQFKVEDFQGGKLKLIIVQNQQQQQASAEGDIVAAFIGKEGTTQSDSDILMTMVKHNIPLTKENINFVKSILDFNGKVINNPAEATEFVNKFISSKGLNPISEQATFIKDTLTEFFSNFKTMNTDDIMLFLENGIDLNSENIESYNRLFKGDESVKQFIDNVSAELKKLDVNIDTKEEEVVFKNKDIENKDIQKDVRINQETTNKASKLYDSNNVAKGKVSVLSLLKTMVNSEVNVMKEAIKEVLIANEHKFTTSEFNSKFKAISSLSNKDMESFISKNFSSEEFSKEGIQSFLSKALGKEVNITTGDMEKLQQILKFELNNIEKAYGETNIKAETNTKEQSAMSNEIQGQAANNEDIVEGNVNSKKEAVKNSNGDVKGSSIDFKSSEDNKASVEKNIKAALTKESIELESKDIIKNEIKSKIQEMKESIKDIIKHTEVKGEILDKVMNLVKANISEFKLLNSVSNEYYYLDIPINKDNKEYPCKLIIKDSRKDGKKIDKTNVKLVVAVKTINIGTIDGYINVSGNFLNVNLKCEEKYVGLINKTKFALIEGLNSLDYVVDVNVSKKEEEVSLTTCREFFDHKHDRAIDTMV